MFRAFALQIVLPTLLSVALFVGTIFLVLIPAQERSILERKREMIRELTNSAWNILANLEQQVKDGRLGTDEAKAQAILQVQNLHYGPHMKDYFWINDMQPRMVVHPYRHDLNGKDLSDFRDPTGKRLFVEVVDVVRRQGAGYVGYRWQWKDDPSQIVPKLSYVKGFAPWGWIIGTGIYLDDVRTEIRQVTGRLVLWSSVILALIAALLFFIARRAWQVERLRRAAEEALRESEMRYRTAIESAGESILMALGDDRLYANASALNLLGYAPGELEGLGLRDLLMAEDGAMGDVPGGGAKAGESWRREALLRRKDGTAVHVLLSRSPLVVGAQAGVILVATDITERKHAEQALGRSEKRLREEVEVLRAREARHRAALEELRLTLALLQDGAPAGPGFRLFEQIRQAGSVEEVVERNRTLPVVIKAMSQNGVRAALLNRLITLDSDAVLERLLALHLEAMGPPPAEFVFLIMGSEGRREQTLRTDQDNALLFADVPPQRLAEARTYFEELGRRVCDDLHRAGYAYCGGEVMAKNPRWCQPLSVWKRLYSDWIHALEAEDLLQAKIFFDFRPGWGQAALAEELRAAMWEALADEPRFFSQLARNVLLFAAPVGLFGSFQLEATPDGRRALNIKSAMVPIVDFARIYALRHRVEANNSVQRLDALRDAGVLPAQSHQEIVEVYAALMELRIGNQVRALDEGRAADNFVEPSRLSHMEQRILKESFAQIRYLQTRLSYDFTGLPAAPT